MTETPAPIAGRAAGVPFLAVPPAEAPGGSAPVVLAWHLFDAPRTETAFAAALPLAGLEAWRIYFGLPMAGSRLPPGGAEAVLQLGLEDAILKLYEPVVQGAVEELGPALADLRGRLGLADGPIGLLGGSIGAAVAQLVLAEGDLDVRAAVLVSPVVQLRATIAAGERMYGFEYGWSPASEAFADRIDFVARAGEIARRGAAPVLLAVGEDDDEAFRAAAAALAAALGPERAELVTIPGMGHALAEEPGMEPAPQTPHAAAVDRRAVEWFRGHLLG